MAIQTTVTTARTCSVNAGEESSIFARTCRTAARACSRIRRPAGENSTVVRALPNSDRLSLQAHSVRSILKRDYELVAEQVGKGIISLFFLFRELLANRFSSQFLTGLYVEKVCCSCEKLAVSVAGNGREPTIQVHDLAFEAIRCTAPEERSDSKHTENKSAVLARAARWLLNRRRFEGQSWQRLDFRLLACRSCGDDLHESLCNIETCLRRHLQRWGATMDR